MFFVDIIRFSSYKYTMTYEFMKYEDALSFAETQRKIFGKSIVAIVFNNN